MTVQAGKSGGQSKDTASTRSEIRVHALGACRRVSGFDYLGRVVTLFLTLGMLAFLALAAPTPAEALPVQGVPAPLLYFVHLGDIWCYDDDAEQAAIAVSAQGRCLGHPSWSLDGTALAWEEREVVDSRQQSRVVFARASSLTGSLQTVWTVEDASSPAVSPDGRYVLFQRLVDGVTSLQVLDSAGQPVLSIADARNGCWVTTGSQATAGSGGGLSIAFDRGSGNPSVNPGFYVRDLTTGAESLMPPANVWAPQAAPGGREYLLASLGEGTGEVKVAKVANGVVENLVDVTKNEAFDYRWRYGHGGTDVPYVELVPMAGGRSDIYRVIDSSGQPGLELNLLAASFGWNASLPARSPFSDFGRGDLYYEAAACLWANQVVGGFDDGTFRPGAPVRRGQLAKMLDGCLGIPVCTGLPPAPFTDLGPNMSRYYPREYISAAYTYGLVQGYSEGVFKPWALVSRMQAVTMVVRAARVCLPWGLGPVPAGWVGATSGFSNAAHGYNVHLAEFSGLLAGIDLSAWDLTAPATRGEVAQMMVDLMRLRGPLFDSDSLNGVIGPRAGSATGVLPGLSTRASIGNIVFDGDSLTAGSTATDPYPSQLMRGFRSGVKWVNLGIGGQRLKDMLDNATSKVDPLYDPGLGQNVVVVWGGTNDMRWWSHTPAAVFSRLKEYCLLRRARGFTVVVLTLLPRSDQAYPPNFEADRQTLNRWVRAGWPGFADALVDVGADRLIGQQGSELDLRFFNLDRVHLNNAGLAVVAGRVGQMLKQLDTAGD